MIPAVVKEAVAAATQRDDGTITLRVPEVHQSNQLFDVWVDDRHLIAKQYLKEDEWAESPVREHASLQLLLPLDIAPRPCFYDATVGPVVVYEYMEGRMWGRYCPSAQELTQLALRMAELHMLPTDGVWKARGSERTAQQRVQWAHQLLDNYGMWAETFYPDGIRIVSRLRPMVAQFGVVIEGLYATMPAPVFCRSDPRFANVIVRPDGRYGFVDWEDAGLRDPALEVADLMLHPEQEDLLTWVGWQPFLTTYCQATGLVPTTFLHRVDEYALVLTLFWMLVMMQHGLRVSQAGELAGWEINKMPANLRFQRYLARAMAESPWDFDADAYADVRFFPTD